MLPQWVQGKAPAANVLLCILSLKTESGGQVFGYFMQCFLVLADQTH